MRPATAAQANEGEPVMREGSSPWIADDEVFVRMTGQQRLQHLLLMVSFTLLVVTGFPLIYPNAWVWDYLLMGGDLFWVRSLVHRICGIGLIVASLWHLAYVLLTEDGSRYFRDMLPKIEDARQAVEGFMYKLGVMEALYRKGKLRAILDRNAWLRFQDPPDHGRFNWIEKFEYLAVVWGNLVMIVTGLALWFFEAAFALFPKTVMDIIKIVHGFEALLAFLAITIWHMYNVHFSPDVFPMSRMWIDGKITGAQMRHHYPAWYRSIEAERRERYRVTEALRRYRELDEDGHADSEFHERGAAR